MPNRGARVEPGRWSALRQALPGLAGGRGGAGARGQSARGKVRAGERAGMRGWGRKPEARARGAPGPNAALRRALARAVSGGGHRRPPPAARLATAGWGPGGLRCSATRSGRGTAALPVCPRLLEAVHGVDFQALDRQERAQYLHLGGVGRDDRDARGGNAG